MSNTTGRKFGGRKKGTPNRLTVERKALLDSFLAENFDEFKERMSQIENPVDFCRLYVALLNFVLPKISSVALKEEKHQETLAEELDRIANE